jgi:hypothetical protein
MKYLERVKNFVQGKPMTDEPAPVAAPQPPVAIPVDPLSPAAEGFSERVSPKKIDETKIFLHKCDNCSGVHFRHAGYVEVLVPFIRSGDEKRMLMQSEPVKVCVNCKHSFVWINEQAYDVTDRIDLTAWERTEREAQRATGPGGQC